jgi:hypothetical protein
VVTSAFVADVDPVPVDPPVVAELSPISVTFVVLSEPLSLGPALPPSGSAHASAHADTTIAVVRFVSITTALYQGRRERDRCQPWEPAGATNVAPARMHAIASLLLLVLAAEAPAVRYPRPIVVPSSAPVHDHGRATEHGWRVHEQAVHDANGGVDTLEDPLLRIERLIHVMCTDDEMDDACDRLYAALALRYVARATYFRSRARALTTE